MKTIRELRVERGWTQLELANRLGLVPSTIHKWEVRGTVPDVRQYRALANVFGVSMEDIALIGLDVPKPGDKERESE